ncbi:MAG TPA: hypothetical protein VGO59_05250 [Verrucomicrobiae bacterium]|jgi:hypothetical protein
MKQYCLLGLFAAASIAGADEVKLSWQPSGVTNAASLRYARLALSPDKPDGIKAVPGDLAHPFLIDGDTGMIIAEGRDARGNALSASIEKALAARQN